MKITTLMAAIITLLQAWDFYSTTTVLRLGGYEQNQLLGFLNRLSATSRYAALLAVKLVALGALWRVQLAGGFDGSVTLFGHAAPAAALLAGQLALYMWLAFHNYDQLQLQRARS